MSTNIGNRSEPVGDELGKYPFVLKASILYASDCYMKNFRTLPLHPIDGAGVTHLSFTAIAMQKSLSACCAILSDESDESDRSEGERTAVHPSDRA